MQDIQDNYLHSSVHHMVLYNPADGTFVRTKSRRAYIIKDDLCIRYYDKQRHRQVCLKAIRVAWEIMNDKVLPKGTCLYHRNFDLTDFRAANIAGVGKGTYSIIREAIANIEHDLKLKVHPTVPHYFIVQWKDKYIREKVVHDVIIAKKMHRKLLIKYTKILGKYCSSL